MAYTIELCGPSAAGKSTIFEQLLLQGKFYNLNCIGMKTQFPYVNNDFKAILQKLQNTAKGNRIQTRINAINRSLHRLYYGVLSENDIAIVDGGTVQRAFMIDLMESKIDAMTYCDSVPTADLAVLVTANTKTLIERNKARNNRQDRSNDSKRVHRLVLSIYSLLRRKNKKVIIIDTDSVNCVEAAEYIWYVACKESKINDVFV